MDFDERFPRQGLPVLGLADGEAAERTARNKNGTQCWGCAVGDMDMTSLHNATQPTCRGRPASTSHCSQLSAGSVCNSSEG
jgi:hypothetical protein